MKKKVILVCVGMICCMSNYAQLKVDSNGLVKIGKSVQSDALLTVDSDKSQGINVISDVSNTSTADITGISIISQKNENTKFTGVFVSPGSVKGGSTQDYYGVRSVIGLTSGKSYGVYGGLFNYGNYMSCQGAGIYGTSTLNNDGIAYPGAYAGYFHGDVRVTGTLYGTLSTPTENSTAVSARVVSLNTSVNHDLRFIDRLQGVSLLQFDNIASDKMSVNKRDLAFPEVGSDEVVTKEMIDEYIASGTPQKTTVSYGLAADQLKDVFPDLVNEDEDGNVSVNYIELVPLLVQALNELNAELAELKSDKEYLTKAKMTATDITNLNMMDVVSLAQNVPNPFSERTTIDVTIPETVRTASLFIYDMNGKQVKQINISERGEYKINITSEGLEAGMYLYSLITDGKIINTKRMILTK